MKPVFKLLPFVMVLVSNLLPLTAKAQTPLPSKEPLNIALLKQPNSPLIGGKVLTATTISQRGLTNPSLWWAREQFAGKLLNNWLAYPSENRVDLIVNQQLWTLLDYMARYSLVNKLGTIARQDGYNIRFFSVSQPDLPLATYTCDFSNPQGRCSIELENSNRDSLGRSTE